MPRGRVWNVRIDASRLFPDAGRIVAATLLLCSACKYTGPTEVAGYVVLAEGETGDVRGTRVQFFDTTGFDGPVRYEAVADTSRFNYRAFFSVPDIPEGDFYVFAWRDTDDDARVSDGDLVGIVGGQYARRDSVQRFHVFDDWTLVSVPDIQLYRYRQVLATVAGERDSTGTRVDLTYQLNHDLLLTTLAVLIPGAGTFPDASAPGWKWRDSTYASRGWNLGGGSMPTGWYVLRFRGEVDGDTFAVDQPVRVR
jgi:hypothetical protein